MNNFGFSSQLCRWTLDFLSNRRQSVCLGKLCSGSLTLNTGAPQGCVLSPLLYSLFTHDCVPKHNANTIVNFADDTTVIGLISDNNEEAYREEVEHLTHWSKDNNLALNSKKTKDLDLDFRRHRQGDHQPISIGGEAVEMVHSFRFLGVHINQDRSWNTNTTAVAKTGPRKLHFLRILKKPSFHKNYSSTSTSAQLNRSSPTAAHYGTPAARQTTRGHCSASSKTLSRSSLDTDSQNERRSTTHGVQTKQRTSSETRQTSVTSSSTCCHRADASGHCAPAPQG